MLFIRQMKYNFKLQLVHQYSAKLYTYAVYQQFSSKIEQIVYSAKGKRKSSNYSATGEKAKTFPFGEKNSFSTE